MKARVLLPLDEPCAARGQTVSMDFPVQSMI
jgi:hypothetical protein